MSGQRKNWILNAVMVLCIAVLAFCGYKIGRSVYEYQKADRIYNELDDLQIPTNTTTAATTVTVTTTQPDVEPPVSGETTEQTTAPDQTEQSTTTTEPPPVVKEPYRAMYDQLMALKQKHPDLFGWIYIEFAEDEIISLPVMKGDDNSYYIDHAYDGTPSTSGAIFADYRNTDRRITLNQNLMLYGHNMNNHSMFNLVSSRYKRLEVFNEVPIMFYSLEGAYTFNVFSVYNAKAGKDDFDTLGFPDDRLKQFCLDKQVRSFYTKNLTFDDVQTIITLITCANYSDDGRVIVHGVLDGYESYFD